jgi:Ca-activated chloride channel family protein
MEFNLSVLQPADPPTPLTDLSIDDLSLSVASITDLLGESIPVTVTLDPVGIETPDVVWAEQPLHLALLMDGSGSLFLTDEQELRLQAAISLVKQFRSNPLDLAAVLRFDNLGTGFGITALGQPLVAAQLLQDFTSDQTKLQEGILLATPGGDTALYDATVEAGQLLSDVNQANDVNRRLVVFTDGIDNDSDRSLEEAITALQALPNGSGQGISTSVVGLGTSLDLIELQELAHSTEGTFALALGPEELNPAFANFFPAAIAENRLQVAVSTSDTLPAGIYLLDGQIRIERSDLQQTAEFNNAVLVVR